MTAPKMITESTPVSVAVAAAVVMIAVAIGGFAEHVRGRLTREEETNRAQQEHLDRSDKILVELKDITKDHEWRLDHFERLREQ